MEIKRKKGWKVIFVFDRFCEECIYENDEEAAKAVRIAVFNNKDAVQCFIYQI